jgi:hypothetical protein
VVDELSCSDVTHDNTISIPVNAWEAQLIQLWAGGSVASVNRLARAEQGHDTISEGTEPGIAGLVARRKRHSATRGISEDVMAERD